MRCLGDCPRPHARDVLQAGRARLAASQGQEVCGQFGPFARTSDAGKVWTETVTHYIEYHIY